MFKLKKKIIEWKINNMSLFDIFKRNSVPDNHNIPCGDKILIPPRQEPQPRFLSACKDIPVQTHYEAYFKNGKLFNVNPRNKQISLYEDRQTAYYARYIISDGIKYDLENPEHIKSIKIPRFSGTGGISSPTGNLDYILKMRLGTENRPFLAVPLAYKVANLMMASPIGWNKKDYYRLAIQLWNVGEIYYADFLLAELKKLLPVVAVENEVQYIYNKSFDSAMNYAKSINTDYILVGYSGVICPDCAPFQNRLYSISGKDKRFPQLPDFIVNNKGLHCNVSMYATIYYPGMTLTQYNYKSDGNVTSKEVDAIKYSNRPFIDDRSNFEKQNYENDRAKRIEQKAKEDNYFERQYWIDKYYEHLEYQQIKDTLGEKAPKSYSGYQRMKKNNTANFQKILEFAQANNIKIN